LLVLDGEGMTLHVEGRPPVQLVAQGEPLRFAGEVATHCELLGGPTRDFNLMTRRGVFEHTLAFHRLGDRLSLASGCRWLIHVVRGEITIAAARVAAGDAVLVENDDPSQPAFEVTGAGDLVLVRLWRI
jgi:hypothetical protein